MKIPREEQPSIFIVGFPGYPFDVLVCIDVTDAQVEQALRGFNRWPEDRDVAEQLAIGNDGSQGYSLLLPKTHVTVLRLRKFRLTPNRIGTMAHEIFHSVFRLFDYLDMRLTHDSEHAYAYAIEGLTNAIFRELASPPRKRSGAVDLRRKR